MRPRSKTVYMRHSPLKKDTYSPGNPTSCNVITTATSPKYTAEYVDSIFDTFGPISDCKVRDNFSGDYQSSSNALHDSLSNVSTSLEGIRSRRVSIVSIDDFLEEEDEPEPTPSKIFRGMVIGAKNTEKHSLVNILYPVEKCEALQNEAKFDLVMRNFEKENLLERYHFWLKEAGFVERRYKGLLNVYYKTCSAFFLVYNEDDKKSFECLESEIDLIKKASDNKEVMLILVSNKDGRECRVKPEEVQHLVDKYKIQMFLEGEEVLTRKEEIKEMISKLMR